MQRNDDGLVKDRPDHIVKMMMLGQAHSGKSELFSLLAGAERADDSSYVQMTVTIDAAVVEMCIYRDPAYRSGLFAGHYKVMCAHHVHAIMLMVDRSRPDGLAIAQSILRAYRADNQYVQHLKTLVVAVDKPGVAPVIDVQAIVDVCTQSDLFGYQVLDLATATKEEVTDIFTKLAQGYLTYALQQQATEFNPSLEQKKVSAPHGRCLVS
jgi:hypothetical protein